MLGKLDGRGNEEKQESGAPRRSEKKVMRILTLIPGYISF